MNRREHDPLKMEPVPVTIELLGEVVDGSSPPRLGPLSQESQKILRLPLPHEPPRLAPLRELVREKAARLRVQIEAESIDVDIVRSSVWIADMLLHPPHGGWISLQHRVHLAAGIQTSKEHWRLGESLKMVSENEKKGHIEVKYRIWGRRHLKRDQEDLLASDGFWDRAIVGVVKLLLENSARTIRHQLDEQRAKFSRRLVEFLANCQQEEELLPAFEDPLVQLHAAQVLHTQSKNSVASSSCPGFDRTRAAGTARMLARSLEPEYPDSATFDPYSKVSYRIVSRIADVLQGKLSGDDNKTIQDLARAEAEMWELGAMQKSIQKANDHFADEDPEVEHFISDPDARSRHDGQAGGSVQVQFAPDARLLQIIAKHVRKVASASESCVDKDQQRDIQERLSEYSTLVKEQERSMKEAEQQGVAKRPGGGLWQPQALALAGGPERSGWRSKSKEPEEASKSPRKASKKGKQKEPQKVQTHTEILLESLQRHESLGASGNVQLFTERPSEIHGSDLRSWQLSPLQAAKRSAPAAASVEDVALQPARPRSGSVSSATANSPARSKHQVAQGEQVPICFYRLDRKSIRAHEGGRRGLLELHFTEVGGARGPPRRWAAAAVAAGCLRPGGCRPMALQAHVREELRRSDSLDAAATHLLWFMGMEADGGGKAFPDLFRRYELNLTGGSWAAGDCAAGAAGSAGALEACVCRKLEGLRALCSVPRTLPREGAAPKAQGRYGRRALRAALRALGRRQEGVPGLGLRRGALPSPAGGGAPGGAEAFLLAGAAGSGRGEALSPAVHATAMATVARCELALGSQVEWSAVAQWFAAAEHAVAQALPQQALTSHTLGIVWEALSFAAAQLPDDRREEKGAAEKVVTTVGKAVRQQLKSAKEDNMWSYSVASATAVRLNTSRAPRRQLESLEKLARAHAERYRDEVLPGINVSEQCTCGPVVGLAPLATLLQDSSLAQLVIELVDKDIRLFQVPQDFASEEGAQLGALAEPWRLRGAFVRHPAQLQREGRPQSLRVDDTATCLAAVSAALGMVESMLGVDDADLRQQHPGRPAGPGRPGAPAGGEL
ncbi:unnamed protein product [Prorocentrum cordatum]|uniref:Uncharacterized protein n=1 Tax=Prorocentrum cordatum TaxID=2364126 RepID=A0ABN9UUT0_9DINO|nr:unnamed protein product [Polarella glacialis]